MQELAYNYQSKFQLVTEPLQCLPHKCAACSRESNYNREAPLQFVDWNLEVEFFGKVLICTDCLREMCNQMGYASPTQVAKLEKEKLLYLTYSNQLEKENQELKNALGSLGVVFNSPTIVINSDPVIKEDDENDDADDVNADDITIGDTEGKTESTEQTPIAGSTDISDNECVDELSDLI